MAQLWVGSTVGGKEIVDKTFLENYFNDKMSKTIQLNGGMVEQSITIPGMSKLILQSIPIKISPGQQLILKRIRWSSFSHTFRLGILDAQDLSIYETPAATEGEETPNHTLISSPSIETLSTLRIVLINTTSSETTFPFGGWVMDLEIEDI